MFDVESLEVDYQLKKEELLKEQSFLQQYQKPLSEIPDREQVFEDDFEKL